MTVTGREFRGLGARLRAGILLLSPHSSNGDEVAKLQSNAWERRAICLVSTN